MNSCIHSGLRWLASSGIQDESGGVARYYRADTAEYRKISTQTTAYYISALLKLQQRQDQAPPDVVLRAAHFLTEHAYDEASELFPFEVGNTSHPPERLAYFFDCGIVIRGLLDLWRVTHNSKYLQCAENCGLALCNRMAMVDGSFFSLYDLSSHHPLSGEGSWPVESGVHHLKVGLAFLELGEETGLGQFKATMESMLRWALLRHESAVPPDAEAQEILDRLHAYCYFLEGLLPFVSIDRVAAQALQFGILRVESLLEDLAPQFQRSDVLAQLLRLRIYADNMGVMEINRGRADQEASLLAEYQVQSTDQKMDGGFAFGRRGAEFVPHIDLSSTLFALQALQMWEEAEDGRFRQPWQTLI